MWNILLFIVTLISNTSILYSRHLGHEETIKANSHVFEGIYIKEEDYDVKDSISKLKVVLIRPYELELRLKISDTYDGSYYGISFYPGYTKKYGPPEDISYNPSDQVIDENIIIYIRAFKDKEGFMFAPVIYKNGYRGKDKEDNNIILSIFDEKTPVLSVDEKPVGDPGNLFTKIVSQNAGKGAVRVKDHLGFIKPNKNNEIAFHIKFNKKINPLWYLAAVKIKMHLLPSKRGLRSPIFTKVFNLSH